MKALHLIIFILHGAVSCSSQNGNEDIVLIGIDNLGRGGIAKEIAIIESLQPRVIAIDLQFSEDIEYETDTKLISALFACKNLVMINVIENYNGQATEYSRFERGSLPEYRLKAKTGFANVILEGDAFRTLKRFSTHEKVNGENEFHFAIQVAMEFDSLKAISFVEKNQRIVDVDYQNGNIDFRRFSSSDVLGGRISSIDIKDKIVIMGDLGPGEADKFYSPYGAMKKSSKPDVYGLEYLACIVAQVLK